MPCCAAMSEKIVTIPQDENVSVALKLFKKHKRETLIVLDGDGKVVGTLPLRTILENAQSITVNVQGGGSFAIDSAPRAGKRLKKLSIVTVDQLMDRNINIVYPESTTGEGLKKLLSSTAMLIVVEPETHKPLGYMTPLTMLTEIERMTS